MIFYYAFFSINNAHFFFSEILHLIDKRIITCGNMRPVKFKSDQINNQFN